MIAAGDFRKGMTIEIDGKVFIVIDFLHVKPGKGAAFVRVKMRNVITGQVMEQTFNPSDKYPQAHIERKDMQYSYNADGLYYFMDLESYETIPLSQDLCEEALKYIKEEMSVQVAFYKGNAFSVDAPNFVELEIAFTEPGLQGDTSRAGTKPATLETGTAIQIPLFVNQGEKIRVDTRNGTYMERVK